MQDEKKYSGYGYHGGGRKATGIKRVSICISGQPEQIAKLKKMAAQEEKTVSAFIFEKTGGTICGDRRMTREEIKQKTSLCFLLNPNVSEEEKNYVIERVMATKATTVSKAALCNIITYIMKQNTKLQEKLNKGL